MLRNDVADQLRANELAPGYVRPNYEYYSFHRVPGTLASLFGVDVGPSLPSDVLDDDSLPDDPSTVVLLFVDAYGWNAFTRTYGSNAFFDAIGRDAHVTPLTSLYPSETAACVPTVHTGRTPIEHGMLGWDAYDPEGDVVYSTLPFQASDDGDIGLERSDLFDGDQIYADLRDAGVETHAVAPAEHRHSGVQVDATFHGYDSTGGFAATLRETIDDAADPSYVYAYYPGIDGVAHRSGPDSPAHDAQLTALGAALERELSRVDDPEDVLCCLVADHGQISTPPAKNSVLPEVTTDAVRRDRNDTPLVTGGPRNIHLHLDDGADVGRVMGTLADHDALVLPRTDALEMGLWGPGESGPAFERNCGDVVVIPREHSLWHPTDAPELDCEGMHGGLHPDEVLVPFASARLSDIV